MGQGGLQKRMRRRRELFVGLFEWCNKNDIKVKYKQIKKQKQRQKAMSSQDQQIGSRSASQYSSKCSSKRVYFGHDPSMKTSPEQSSEFSFSKNVIDTAKNSIREDLSKLNKEDLIQLVLEQIQEAKILRIKLSTLQEQCKIMDSFRQQQSVGRSSHELISLQKYQQLSDYMEEYISNTNQAQQYFSNLIKELKQQNSSLSSENKRVKQKQREGQQKIEELEQNIRNLEESVHHYVHINNQNTRKYDKMKKMYEMQEQQLATLLNYTQHQPQQRHAPNLQLQLQQREQAKLLQIQNSQLKQCCLGLQRALKTKSDKIRKLLEQLQKLSQQKWLYKERYMQLKSKSYMLTNSSSKNSVFETSVQQEIQVEEYSSIKA